MAHHEMNQADVEAKLWRAMDDTRIGMLGVAGGEPQHMQPMTAFAEPYERTIWFYTYRDTDLVRDVGAGHAAMFCLVSKDREIYACFGGELSEAHDPERMDRYWGPVVAAWYPEGRKDPRLTMLRLDLHDAQVWVSEAGPVKFGWEVAKANLTKSTPDFGGRADLNFQ